MSRSFKINQKNSPSFKALRGNAEVLLYKEVALQQRRQFKKVQVIYKEKLKTNPNHFNAVHLLGITAYQIGSYQESADLIAKAIVINPDNPAPYNNIDNASADLNQLQAAVASDWQACEAQAVRIGPKSGHAKNFKEKLKCNSMDAPLFDTQRLMRHIEIAYAQMHQRVQQGLGQQAFEVQTNGVGDYFGR